MNPNISPEQLNYLLALPTVLYYVFIAYKQQQKMIIWAIFASLLTTGITLILLLFIGLFISLYKILSWPINDFLEGLNLVAPFLACLISLKLAPFFITPQENRPSPPSSDSDILDADL